MPARLLLLALLALVPACQRAAFDPVMSSDDGPEHTRVVVFVQPDKPVDMEFVADWLPAVREEADAAGLPVTVIDVSRGAPPAVTVTPLIAMHTPLGRSLYQGRYTTLDRLRNFLRTARRVPQAPGGITRDHVAAMAFGRSQLAAPIKIAAVTGTRPDGHDDETFEREARRAIARGFHRFDMAASVEQQRADRAFYMDFYPWLSDDGTLYLSLAIYSQFHCKQPVFITAPDVPLVAPWNQRGLLFARAARLLEKEVLRQVTLGETGDGISPVASSLRDMTWDALGMPLVANTRGAERAAVMSTEPLPLEWTLERGDAPSLLFHLAAPLDGYAGEVAGVAADITLAPAEGDAIAALVGATGTIKATTRTVTMGDADLDEAVLGSAMLRVSRHPEATFTIDAIDADAPLAYGRLTPASARGTFSLKGIDIPLTLAFQVEPTVADDGTPRLLADGSFAIRLRDPFGIVGLSEPMPAADTVEFDFAFRLMPRED